MRALLALILLIPGMVPAAPGFFLDFSRFTDVGGERQSLTIVPVEIDPLGAPPDTPWIVHVGSANVRPTPSLSSTPITTYSGGRLVTGPFVLVVETDLEWVQIVHGETTAYISSTTIYRPHPRNVELLAGERNLPYGREIVNRWWGLPSTYEPDDLETLSSPYATSTQQLRREAAAAFRAMRDAAAADGVLFRAGSTYRSWSRQQQIYLGNVANDPAQRFSAPPGHSEHQLGATVDITDSSTGDFVDDNTPVHDWLLENAPGFGFRQTYRDDNIAQTGYIAEPWHWRYVGTSLDTQPDCWIVQ